MIGVGVLVFIGVFEILKDILVKVCIDEDLVFRVFVCIIGLGVGVFSLGVFIEFFILDGVFILGIESFLLVCGVLLKVCGLFGVDGFFLLRGSLL